MSNKHNESTEPVLEIPETEVMTEEQRIENDTEGMNKAEKLAYMKKFEFLKSFKSQAIACESLTDALKGMVAGGWSANVVSELKQLKEINDGTVFTFTYANFCDRYNAGKRFASTGNSVRTKIAKIYELDTDTAKLVVPYNNTGKDGKRATGSLVINYELLEL